ncbi:hypothetical protein ACER0A_005225 [Haloimpatiens sp. FM7315]|uniref:hypothetical protein n=1 Tax=Haloimpatiens sp. FM7315 TaxID=3298609 RepID=UPI00370CE5C8
MIERIYTSKILIDNKYYTVATAMYDKDILQITHRITSYVFILILVTCIIIIILFSIVVNKLTSPFKLILKGVRNFSQKKYDQTIQIDTKDEFQYLAQEMNNMAQTLKQLDIKEKNSMKIIHTI